MGSGGMCVVIILDRRRTEVGSGVLPVEGVIVTMTDVDYQVGKTCSVRQISVTGILENGYWEENYGE